MTLPLRTINPLMLKRPLVRFHHCGGAETSVAGNDASPATDKIRKSEWIAIGINVFIALVIFWQAWIYNEQRKATRIAERGYVGAKTIALIDFKIGVIPYIEVTFLNGGRTPIWNLYTPASFEVSDEPPNKTVPLSPPKDEPGAFLPANLTGTFRYFFPRALDAKLDREFMDGSVKLYFYGIAWFDDCWGERRSFPFDYVYNPIRRVFEDNRKYSEYIDAKFSKNAPTKRQPAPR